MSTFVYDKAREAFMGGDIDLASDDIRAILIDAADYTASQSADDFLSDIPGGARVSVSAALSGKTITNGVFNHSTGTFSSVTGDVCEAVVYYKHTGVEGTSHLICYVDNFTGLPVTPNGNDITFTPSTGSNKLFKL